MIQIQHLLMLNMAVLNLLVENIDSNTTLVNVKYKEIYAQGTSKDEFKYNTC